MIPKVLHFIWLGNADIPDYGKFAIDAFSKVNRDFEVNVLHDDPDCPKTNDLAEFLKLAEDENTFYSKLMYKRKWAQENLKTEKGINCKIADSLRVYLVQKYGGIYLDLDTFPVKPFDEFLLSKRNFTVKYRNDRYDNFFFGSEQGKVFNDFIYFNEDILDHDVHHADLVMPYPFAVIWHSKHINPSCAEDFYSCKLKYGNHLVDNNLLPYYYIDHFLSRSWKQD